MATSADESDGLIERMEGEELAERTATIPAGPLVVTAEAQHGLMFRLLRWPLFAVFCAFLLVDLWLYFLLRQFVRMYEFLCKSVVESGRLKALKRRLAKAGSYGEWKAAAIALDTELGNDKWIEDAASTLYNFRLITQLTGSMREARQHLERDPSLAHLKALTKVLLDGSLRHNVGGIEDVALYAQTHYGTKRAIQAFVEELERSLLAVESLGAQAGASDDLLRLFYKKAAGSYGRSVLCLSGGGSSGYYHLGVVRTLGRAGLLPQVVCGTSAGAAIASYLCTHTDEELARDLRYADDALDVDDAFARKLCAAFEFTTERSWWPWLRRLLRQGHLMNAEEATERLRAMCNGDLTFEEAHRRTGRILNITITTDDEASPPQILNHQTTPDVIIHTAVLASASIPGLLPSVTLLRKRRSIDLNHGSNNQARSPPDVQQATPIPYEWLGSRWRDGSFLIDVPIEHLRPMFNIKFSLVSQVNPGASLFFFDSKGRPGQPHSHRHGRGYRAGFVSTFVEALLKLDMKRHLELLGSLQLVPRFLKQDWTLLLLQRRDGTATILPSTDVHDLTHLVASPTPAAMQTYVRKGERATWPILKLFDNRLRAEKILTRNLLRMKAKATAAS